MRCLASECETPAIPTTARCGEHWPGGMRAYAEEYAVASIVYYSGAAREFMSDARFDGLCDTLLKAKAWKEFPWIEREMLIAGSGYDLAKFPQTLHDAAKEFTDG